MDRGASDDRSALPYALTALQSAREGLGTLEDASLSCLTRHHERLEVENPDLLAALYPNDPDQILSFDNLTDLFDTTPDLDGANIDISPFIQSGEERDVSIYWRPIDGEPCSLPDPTRDELCCVTFLKIREWIGKGKVEGWIWDYALDRWIAAKPAGIYPGQRILMSFASGGYSAEFGWTGRATDKPPLIEPVEISPDPDRSSSSDLRSISGYKTIATHSWEVLEKLRQIAAAVNLEGNTEDLLCLVAMLHDWGKAHPVFQEKIKLEKCGAAVWDLAKAPGDRWEKGKPIRHELASALAIVELLRLRDPGHPALDDDGITGRQKDGIVSQIAPGHPIAEAVVSLSAAEFDLLIFLVASHHGKVRATLSSTPQDEEFATGGEIPIRGVYDGDVIPPVCLTSPTGDRIEMPEITLRLDLAEVGLSNRYGRSWTERINQRLADREHGGIFRIAYLDSIVRAADCRASALTTPDPNFS
ncbi:MAG: CRISPR-associated endonuclease/helicase Cas3 [Pseudoalteromonas tetraodonis]